MQNIYVIVICLRITPIEKMKNSLEDNPNTGKTNIKRYSR